MTKIWSKILNKNQCNEKLFFKLYNFLQFSRILGTHGHLNLWIINLKLWLLRSHQKIPGQLLVNMTLQWFFFNLPLVRKTYPSKDLLISKTSWRSLLNISWKRLEDIFSVTISRLLRCLQGIFRTSWKMSYKTMNCYVEDILKACFKAYWRSKKCLVGKESISVSSKSKCASHKFISIVALKPQKSVRWRSIAQGWLKIGNDICTYLLFDN